MVKEVPAVLLDVAQSFTRLGPQSSAKTNCVFTRTPETQSIALKSGDTEEIQSFARFCGRP